MVPHFQTLDLRTPLKVVVRDKVGVNYFNESAIETLRKRADMKLSVICISISPNPVLILKTNFPGHLLMLE